MGSVDDVPTGRIKPKKEPSFGKKPSNGTFGKKPSKGNFGKKITLRSGRTKPASRGSFGRRKTKVKRYELVLPSYMKYLHDKHRNEGKDVHHWITRSKIGRNDFFVSMVEHNYHINTIHGKLSPSSWIEQEGEENLLFDSLLLFSGWLASSDCNDYERGYFSDMVREIKEKCFDNPSDRIVADSVNIVSAYIEEYNSTVKNPHH